MENGNNTQFKNPKKAAKIGEPTKIKKIELRGITISFNNNLKASENGCRTPAIPILLGPLLCWSELICLRSNKVMNAVLKIKSNNKINTDNKKYIENKSVKKIKIQLFKIK